MRKALGREPPCQIPIIDASLRVVGWTSHVPVVRGMDVSHVEAESLLGGPIDAVYVELRSRKDAIVAGAPHTWRGPWRCLALADKRAAQIIRQSAELTASLPPPL